MSDKPSASSSHSHGHGHGQGRDRGLGPRLLGRLADLVTARPRAVVLVAVALAAVAITQVVQLEVTTSRTGADSAQIESAAHFARFLEEFGTPNDLIAVIDGGTGEARRAATDELAAALGRDPHVRSTFHKVDLEFFIRRILLFTPTNELGQIKQMLQSSYVDDVRAGKVQGIDYVIDEVTSAFAGRAAANIDPQRMARGVDAMAVIAEELAARLRDPRRTGLEGIRALLPPLSGGAIDDGGYLQSRDGQMRVMFVAPRERSDETSVVMPVVKAVRRLGREVAARHPGTRVRVTGLPALQSDETEVVEWDVKFTTGISLGLIALLMVYGYRRPQQVLLSLVPLLIGIVWTLAFARLYYQRINFVASAFMPILLGRGSDFAIYLIARFNAARGAGASPREAVRESLVASGGGVITGALVTSAAFLVTTLSSQYGVFHQLGTVVGVGLVLVLLASLVVTPALLLLLGERRLPGEERAERLLDRLPHFGAGPGSLSLRWPGTVLGLTAAATVVLAGFARSVPFDYDLLKFLPPEAESVTAQQDLSRPAPHGSDFGTDVAVIAAPDIETARRMAAELQTRPSVGRVDTIGSFLPADQEAKLAEIARMRDLVESIPEIHPPTPPTTPQTIARALDRLGDAVDDAIFLAQKAGHPTLEPLKRLGAAVTAARSAVDEQPPEVAGKRVAHIEDQIFSLLIRMRGLLRDNVLGAQPLRLEDLPAATRERFMGRSGKIAVYVFPRKAGAGEELTAFVTDVRSVAPEATGFPVIYHDSSRAILPTFWRAAWLSLAVIVLALLLHFRSLIAAGLALLPLVLASVAMAGLMGMLDVPHNVANIVALPLLIGLGTDYGLQLIHHRRTVPDESLRQVLQKTGLGVFIAGGSTATGFGALALARHQGGHSLGLVLFLGSMAALVAALVVLPAVLVLMERRGLASARRGAAAEELPPPPRAGQG